MINYWRWMPRNRIWSLVLILVPILLLGWTWSRWRGYSLLSLFDALSGNVLPESADCDNVHVVTIMHDSNEDMWRLRELVGSLQIHCAPEIAVLTLDSPSEATREEVGVWSRVRLVEAKQYVLGQSGYGAISISAEQAKEHVRRSFGFGQKYSVLVDVRARIEALGLLKKQIERYGCVRAGDLIEGCIRGANPSTVAKLALEELGVARLPDSSTDQLRGRCTLRIRPDALHTGRLLTGSPLAAYLQSDGRKRWEEGRTRIALLVPTKSLDGTDIKEQPLLATLIPSLIASLTHEELQKYTIALYVGYDHGDTLFDGDRKRLLSELQSLLRSSPIIVKLVRLPVTRWLTLLWNILYSAALEDGADYFYQLGDDVSLIDAGWLDPFVAKLQSMNNIGVVAPNDTRWGCRLYTQSFVSRAHFDIFGYYFPLSISNWYCDNWITEVYDAETKYCFRNKRTYNTNVNTRYNPCTTVAAVWKAQARRDQVRLYNWLNQ